jgi:hypothetical protein
MLNLKNSDDVIAALVAWWQIKVPDCDAEAYRETPQNLVRIARYEQTIATNEDMRRVEEIARSSKH